MVSRVPRGAVAGQARRAEEVVAAAAACGERVAPGHSVARAASNGRAANLVRRRDAERGPEEQPPRLACKETAFYHSGTAHAQPSKSGLLAPLPALCELGHGQGVAIGRDWAQGPPHPPCRCAMREADAKEVARLVAGEPDRLLGRRRTARMHVRALCGRFGREVAHGPRQAVALMRAESAVLRGDHIFHHEREQLDRGARERVDLTTNEQFRWRAALLE